MLNMLNEIKRLQELAGIKTPKITLYATWISLDEDLFKSPDLKLNKNHSGNIIGSIDGNGYNGNKKVILCVKNIWPYIGDPDEGEADDSKIVMVKFTKNLDEIFLDNDDNAFEFYPENNKKISLYELFQMDNGIYNNDENDNWYGCYVDDIKSNEIISIREDFQDEDGNGNWDDF